MSQLFLSSFSSNVASLFVEFTDDTQAGKRVSFIPTTANPEKVRFFVDSDRKALEKIGMIIDEMDISTADYGSFENRIDLRPISNDQVIIVRDDLVSLRSAKER